jgi:hypothetical protein
LPLITAVLFLSKATFCEVKWAIKHFLTSNLLIKVTIQTLDRSAYEHSKNVSSFHHPTLFLKGLAGGDYVHSEAVNVIDDSCHKLSMAKYF